MTKKKLEPNAAKPKYEPTSRERTAINKFLTGIANAGPRLKVVDEKQGVTISPDHPVELVGSALLMEALGAADQDFLKGLLGQLSNASSMGPRVDEQALNFMLSVVKGVQPRDQLEAMLAAQMAAVHVATMTFGQRLAQVERIDQQDSAERAFNKLARTFTTQLEALKRYRTGGEQKVTVQHVSVSEGGQAIVGTVTHAARESVPEKTAKAVPALADVQQAPMTIIGEPERAPAVPRRIRKE